MIRKLDDIAASITTGISIPLLEEGESLVLDSLAVRERGIFKEVGRLILTNQRLIFMPMRWFRLRRIRWLGDSAPLDIRLREITNVEMMPRRFLSANPFLRGVRVSSTTGKPLQFLTSTVDRWHTELMRLRDVKSLD